MKDQLLSETRALLRPDRDTHGYVYLRVRRSASAERFNRFLGALKLKITAIRKSDQKVMATTIRKMPVRLRGFYTLPDGTEFHYDDAKQTSRTISAWRTENAVALSDLLSLLSRHNLPLMFQPDLGFCVFEDFEAVPHYLPSGTEFWASTPRGALELYIKRDPCPVLVGADGPAPPLVVSSEPT